MNECILCYEDSEIFGVGKCNHSQVCYLCIIKCRNKMNNKQCPICKEELDEIILTKTPKNFNQFDPKEMEIYGNGILYDDIKIKVQLDKLNQYSCWLPGCKFRETQFNSMALLKKHLKDMHQRYLCDTCLEFKTALLSEQKLYTHQQIENHLRKGDEDEDGNIIFYHPYCSVENQQYLFKLFLSFAKKIFSLKMHSHAIFSNLITIAIYANLKTNIDFTILLKICRTISISHIMLAVILFVQKKIQLYF